MSIISAADLGLGWSITRAVAADAAGGGSDNTDFVRSATTIYLLLGLAGCVIIGLAGLLASERLRLPPVKRDTVVQVFWLIGAVFCADRLGVAGAAVLSGLRRFSLLNMIAATSSLVWAAGVVAVLLAGGRVIAMVACQLAIAVTKSMVMIWFAARLSPGFRFKPLYLRWTALRHHVSFAVSSQIVSLMGSLSSNAGPLLLGFISGSAAAVPFYVSQKFTTAISSVSWRAAEVLFPAASASRDDTQKSAEILHVGSRLIIVLALPFTVLLFATAPAILRAWLGSPPPGSVAVLRILAVATLADAIMVAPLYVLWGRGKTRPILVAFTTLGVGGVMLTGALAHPFGAPGAAYAVFFPAVAGAVIVSAAASRECQMDAWRLAAAAWRGLLPPVLACALGALAFMHFWHDSRLSAVAAAAVGILSYTAVLFVFSASAEEKGMARTALSRSKNGALWIFRRLRGRNAPR
jgi:O-antigen/teichoic acid export membrane protein